MRHTLSLFGLLVLAAVMSGCASTSLELNFIAIKPVNVAKSDVDAEGASRVVDVRIYQLKTNNKFNDASVENVWVDAEGTLGDSLIEVKAGESIFPEDPKDPRVGRVITIDPVDANTKFIGVLALFSEGENDRKVSVPLEEAGEVIFELTGYRIVIKKN